MNTLPERDSLESVPKVGEGSVGETRLSGGMDANSRFGDLPCEVIFKIFLELLFVTHVCRDIGHHDGSIADSLMLVVYSHYRVNGRLEEVSWVGMPILRL